MKNPAPRLYLGSILLLLAFSSSKGLYAQSYRGNLSCLSTNSVALLGVAITCERNVCSDPPAPCPEGQIANYTPGLSCQGVTDTDKEARFVTMPACITPGCFRLARITYSCNNGVPMSGCLKVPEPGSGKSSSTDLSCSPADAILSIFEEVFVDGFESGDTSEWSETVP